ncbi:hypothetical protein, partial [Clostridioides difficile]|uniref:hypothetical protein n=1 Tax=Clostridioides difficile TaxID=1496 RepID=UPI0018F8BD2E
GSPLISLTVLTSTMSAITGSSSGALGIVMPNFADYYLSTGLNATAEDVANIGPIEPLAPMLNVCILDDRNLWNKKADKRIATI